MPIALPLPPTTTLVFETGELVRLSIALESLEKQGKLNSELARLQQMISAALAAPLENDDAQHPVAPGSR